VTADDVSVTVDEQRPLAISSPAAVQINSKGETETETGTGSRVRPSISNLECRPND
jgi:hypothetical protein